MTARNPIYNDVTNTKLIDMSSGAGDIIATALLPVGSSSQLGVVKVDGTTITATGGTISAAAGGSGTVTHTAGALTLGQLIIGNGAADIKVGDLTGDITTSGATTTTIANNAVTTAKLNNTAVTLAKIQNATANSKLLGSGAAGSGASYSEITLGTGLSMSGTTLNSTVGTVTSVGLVTPSIFTVSGSPVTTTGNLTFTLNTQSANLVLGGPSTGSAAIPTFRALVAADLPTGVFPQLIATATPSGVSTITFSSIPAGFSALKLIGYGRSSKGTTGSDPVILRFNSDGTANYQFQQIFSNGSTPAAFNSGGTASVQIAALPSTANIGSAGTFEIIIPGYSQTSFQKSALAHYTFFDTNMLSSMYDIDVSAWWNNTAAIMQIDLIVSATWLAGSKVVLYGYP